MDVLGICLLIVAWLVGYCQPRERVRQAALLLLAVLMVIYLLVVLVPLPGGWPRGGPVWTRLR